MSERKLNPTERAVRSKHFIEELGVLMEETGGQRIMGRIMGYLLICVPEHQSSAQLAEALESSRGAISTATRSLAAAGIVQRVNFPGDRASYFRIKADAMQTFFQTEIARFAMWREIMERGLAITEGDPPEHRRRMQDFHGLFAFLESEFPALLERWIQQGEQ